tara:strand:+ start:63326 stop:64018 length:693 start_codon:yes stop_codon:yes gene_type:complete
MGNSTSSPLGDITKPEPKRRGRKPGCGKVPGSGRKPGVTNKIPKDMKSIILARGKPLELLCDISRGVKIRTGPQAGPGEPQYTYPTLQERAAAAKILLDKLMPAANGVAGKDGEDGAPLTPSFDKMNPIEQRDVARRLAYVLTCATEGAQGSEPEALPDPEPQTETWYNATTPPDPKPAQVIPPKPQSYHYEPTAEELARREFDAHINRASNRAMDGGISRPNVITQRPR